MLVSSKAKDFAVDVAKEAGSVIRSEFRLGMKRSLKSDKSFVTESDIKINSMVIRAVKKEFPNHDIFAEEGSSLGNKSGYTWVCDPIDGTIAFSHGVPTSAFSLALVKDGKPIIGVVYDPFMDRMYSAQTGKGSFLNGERIRVSNERKLKGSIVALSHWNGAQFDLSKLYERLIDSGASVLKLGSIVYGGALVSVGEFSASVHPAKASYDSAALKVIIDEAKGKVTDIFGDNQRYDGKINGAIMSNGLVHAQLVKLVRK